MIAFLLTAALAAPMASHAEAHMLQLPNRAVTAVCTSYRQSYRCRVTMCAQWFQRAPNTLAYDYQLVLPSGKTRNYGEATITNLTCNAS